MNTSRKLSRLPGQPSKRAGSPPYEQALSQMEDYSIFSARGKISIFVQQYFCEVEILI